MTRVPWRDYDPDRPPRLSDIGIQRVYEVICEPCGGSVVDAPKTYAEAIEARRLHFQRAHAR